MAHLFAILPVLLLSLTPALAETASNVESLALSYAHIGVTALGLVFAVGMAAQAFGRRALPLAETPTFPRYMTSRGQYMLGNCVFVIFASFVFLLIVYLHKEVVEVLQIFPGLVPEPVVTAIAKNEAPYLLVVAAMGVLYLIVLQKESNWNVLLMVRDIIQSWISVPQLGHNIVSEISFSLTIPPKVVNDVVAVSTALEPADFDKGSMSINRTWAEVSYMRWWVLLRRKQGSDAIFFAEPSFALDQLLGEYDQVSDLMGSLKKGQPLPPRVSPETVSDRVKSLHLKFSRNVACLLLYRNGSKQGLASEARAFGIPFEDPRTDNPLKYAVIYLLALIVAVYVSVFGSAVIYDLFTSPTIAAALTTQDVGRAFSWILYSLSNYGLAIVVVLALRLAIWKFGSGRPSLLPTYCWTFVVACCVGPFGLTLAAKLNSAEQVSAMSYLGTYVHLLRWGVGPGLVAVCITWFMDRQTSSDLPNIDTSMITRRVMNSVIFASFTIILQSPQILTISQPDGDWDVNKLRAVAAGVTFFITLALALVAQFVLLPPHQDQDAAPVTAPAE